MAQENEMASADQEQSERKDPEQGKLFSKRFFVLILVPMWSFFFFFLFFYLVSMNDYKQKWADLAKKYNKTKVVEPIAFPDSLVSEPMTVTIGSSEWDSLFFNALLTPDDKLRILNIENTRRQREIDFLYNQLVEQKEYIVRLEQTLKTLSPENMISLMLEKYPHIALAPPEEPDTVEVIEKPESELEMPFTVQAIKSSAKIYEAMKPDVAAQILSNIDEQLAASILANTNQRKAAKILESMEKKKATALSQLMVSNS